MVAYKTGSFQRILKLLDPSCRAGLVYGPDAGLVAERAAALADVFAGKRKDAVEIVRRAAAALPSATLITYPGEAHLSTLCNHFDEIARALAAPPVRIDTAGRQTR